MGEKGPFEQSSKRIKLQILLSTSLVILGLLFAIAAFWLSNDGLPRDYNVTPLGVQIGFWIVGVGLVWTSVARTIQWWYHG